MDDVQQTPDDQATSWNGIRGQAWVEAQEVLDRVLQPFEDLLVEGVPTGTGARVLDVGCGTGSTTLAVAQRLGAQGRSIGIDISAPMIAAARARAESDHTPASFILADAQTHAFEPGTFDAIVSRFGVMFFDDPVRAFANLRRAARVGGALRFVAWRSAAENPFMTTAERAAAPLLPNLPASRPDEPGRFAFADSRRVYRVLEESGWDEIEVREIDVACTLPEPALVQYLTRFGPVGQVLHEVDDETRARVIETVRAAFDPYVYGAEVRFVAACWLVGARAPSASAAS